VGEAFAVGDGMVDGTGSTFTPGDRTWDETFGVVDGTVDGLGWPKASDDVALPCLRPMTSTVTMPSNRSAVIAASGNNQTLRRGASCSSLSGITD
jgi:hypothetical protein